MRRNMMIAVCGFLLCTLVFAFPAYAQSSYGHGQPSAGSSATAAEPQNPQIVACPAQQALFNMPELSSLKSNDHILKGTIRLTDGLRLMWGNTGDSRCATQYLRYFEIYDPAHPQAAAATPASNMPVPGPTLRAHVGDLVELTFLNDINTQHFANTLDQGEQGKSDGCDQVYGTKRYPGWAPNKAYKTTATIIPGTNNPGSYAFTATKAGTSGKTPPTFPQTPGQTVTDGTVTWTNSGHPTGDKQAIYPGGDTMPNCLHGSSTANIHFHGTHTTPSTTGDNVLLYIRPANRPPGGQMQPTDAEVAANFKQIFASCEKDGSPTKWSQIPKIWRDLQEKNLVYYDDHAPYKGVNGTPGHPALPPNMRLWPQNQMELDAGLWPQYHVRAYPYCFRLPEYVPAPKGQTPKYQMGQAPGTHWYHAHKHGSTALNIANGMTGVFIIEGQYDADLKKFYGDKFREQVLMIQQLSSQPFPLVNPATTLGPGRAPRPPISVNGSINPIVSMQPGEVQLWRMVNGAFRDAVQLEYFTGANSEPCNKTGPSTLVVPCLHWRQIAQDGVQFIYQNYQTLGAQDRPVNLAAANRADLLVKAPQEEGTYVLVILPNEGLLLQKDAGVVPDKPVPLLTVKVSGTKLSMDFIQNESDFPKFPDFLADIPTSDIYINRRVVFGAGNSTIDNESFNPHQINQAMLLNSAEQWTVMNVANDKSHPFHIHINPFQITALFQPNDAAAVDPQNKCYADPNNPATWKPCHPFTGPFVWWDTFAIPTGRTDTATVCNASKPCPPALQPYVTGDCDDTGCPVTIPGYFVMRSRFVDFTGQYVIHCHILIHEDRGMMQLIEVVPDTTPYMHN